MLVVECPAVIVLMTDHEPVDHDLDRVALVLIERLDLVEVEHLAVDADAHEALLASCVKDAITLGLPVTYERAQDQDARAIGQGQDLVDDLLHALALDLMAVWAARMAGPGKEQAQVVVDLRHGSDSRARVARGALLVDRDRRRQAVDLIDVGFLHLAQELASVSRQRLDVAALSLGIDRVEGEARLATA